MNREEIITKLEAGPENIKYTRLCKICDHFFGEPRQNGTSQRVYKMPWKGDPRVNIQKKGNKAKAYQVRQVINALRKL